MLRTPVLDLFRPAMQSASRAYFGLTVRGVEHIPRSGGLIITPNHQTYADPPLVSIAVRRRVYYMAWSRLFEVPILGSLIRMLRAFPVDLESRHPSAVREARRLLKAGAAVMIFPEGGRTLDGALGDFKAGAFRLAVAAGVPVLPVTISGGHEAWPPTRVLPRRGRIAITYHPVLHAVGGQAARDAALDLAERTRRAITSALGEVQVPRSSTG